MKARVVKNPAYPRHFTVGEIYPARLAADGVNYMVQSVGGGLWLCMRRHEIRFICPAVMVPKNG